MYSMCFLVLSFSYCAASDVRELKQSLFGAVQQEKEKKEEAVSFKPTYVPFYCCCISRAPDKQLCVWAQQIYDNENPKISADFSPRYIDDAVEERAGKKRYHVSLLELAIRRKNTEAVKSVLNAKACVIPSNWGASPLAQSMTGRRPNYEIITLLLDHGAYLSADDMHGFCLKVPANDQTIAIFKKMIRNTAIQSTGWGQPRLASDLDHIRYTKHGCCDFDYCRGQKADTCLCQVCRIHKIMGIDECGHAIALTDDQQKFRDAAREVVAWCLYPTSPRLGLLLKAPQPL